MCIFTATTSHFSSSSKIPRSLSSSSPSLQQLSVPRRAYSLPSQQPPFRGNSRATNYYLLGLSSHGLSNIAAVLSCPTLPHTLPCDARLYMQSRTECARAKEKKKKKEKRTGKKNERKREKKALLVFKWRIVIVSGA